MYTDCGLSLGNSVLPEMAAEAKHFKDHIKCVVMSLRCSKRYKYCVDSFPLITDIFAEADQSLFRRILNN